MTPAWRERPVFIQSFAPTSLVRAAELTDSPLVFLVDDVTVRTEDTNQSYDEVTSGEHLDYMKRYGVVGIGPWKDTVVPPNQGNLLRRRRTWSPWRTPGGCRCTPTRTATRISSCISTSGRTPTPSTTTGLTTSASMGSSPIFRRASTCSRSGQPRRGTDHDPRA
jgi:hypothetical protein